MKIYKCPFCGGSPTPDHNCEGLKEATKKYTSPEWITEGKRIAEFSKSHIAIVEDGNIIIKEAKRRNRN